MRQGLKTTSWVPPGVVWEYVGATPPSGWLFCDGSAISRAEYPELFQVIGIRYGAGDGYSTFNLPNRKGRIGVGLDVSQSEFNTLGLTGGFKDKNASHTHDMGNHTHSRTAAGPSAGTGGASTTAGNFVNWTGGRGGQSINHSHGFNTKNLAFWGDGAQGWAANDNHQGAQTTDRSGQLLWSGNMLGRNSIHAHGLTDHRHGLESHNHNPGVHTHSDTFAAPSPNVTGGPSQTDPTQPNAGNLQPYTVTNFIVKS